jgi:folate-binding protein YgfZ
MTGYEALRQGAAWLDASARGKIRVTGQDRARLLHAMTTNEVQKLSSGELTYAFFLNAQGRILADAYLLCREHDILLDTEPGTREKIYQHLDKFIIADDVTLEDLTAGTATISLAGPRAGEVLDKAGAPVPGTGHAAWGGRTVARISLAGGNGFLLLSAIEDRSALIAALAAAGAELADDGAFRVVRIENGRPRYGEEITERFLVQETGQMHAVSFSKGCYLGQEIVERVRSRAQIHRRLLPVSIATDSPPPPSTKFQADGRDAAELMSAVFSPALGCSAGLAYVRIDVKPGDVIAAGGIEATVLAAPPAPTPEPESSH